MDENALKDLPIQAENLAFAAEEMLVCGKCERANPPTRLECFYCGAELAVGEEQKKFLKPNLRRLEPWEKGFNLIVSAASAETNTAEIAKLLNLEREALEKVLEAKKPLPLARVGPEKEAEIICERLRENGVEAFVLSDEALNAEKPPVRLRGLEFVDERIVLILFNNDEIAEIALENLGVIVTGAIFERRVEATEKRNKKGDNKILKSTETASDDFLVDIYDRNFSGGFRIFAKGFDFSCLEKEKEILAKDNLKKLAQKLSEAAPNAKLVDDYLEVRENLGGVWEVEERKDSRGLQRERFGKFNLGNVTTVNNAAQFTKYSRLQWRLLSRERRV